MIGILDDKKSKELHSQIDNLLSEREPLLLSMLSSAYEDLKLLHKHLNIFCSAEPPSSEKIK